MGGFVVRDTLHPLHVTANEAWWSHIAMCDCLNDQVALHFTQQLDSVRGAFGLLKNRLWATSSEYHEIQRRVMEKYDAHRSRRLARTPTI